MVIPSDLVAILKIEKICLSTIQGLFSRQKTQRPGALIHSLLTLIQPPPPTGQVVLRNLLGKLCAQNSHRITPAYWSNKPGKITFVWKKRGEPSDGFELNSHRFGCLIMSPCSGLSISTCSGIRRLALNLMLTESPHLEAICFYKTFTIPTPDSCCYWGHYWRSTEGPVCGDVCVWGDRDRKQMHICH